MAYTPAGLTTGSATLAHLAMVFYRKTGLDRLQSKFVFRTACMKDMISRASGRTVQFFRYTSLAANTTAATEGAVGSSGTITSKILQATVSQYAAFITVADLLKETAIDPIVAAAADLLGESAGLSNDTIARGVMDAESGSTNQALLATYLRVSDIRSSRHLLQGANVKPFDNNKFKVFTHPYTSYDLVNDPNALGLADIVKYNTNVNSSALVRYEDRGIVADVAGCEVTETTNVYSTGSPATYRTYVFGKNAVASVDLEGRGPTDVVDPSKQRFNIDVIPGTKSLANPEGLIGGAVSYNYVTTNVVLEGPAGIGGTYRYKTLDPYSTIA